MSKAKSISNVRKIVYACIFLAAVAIVATVVAVSTANQGVKLETDKQGGKNSSADISSVDSGKTSEDINSADTSSDKPASTADDKQDEDVTPTVKEVAFLLPVENGELIKEYTDATVVYNQTLGIYTGHLALDITGPENANVLTCFDGEVEAIKNAYLEGTSVTINHGNGLKTVYNSIEVADGLNVGDKLSKGAIIGVISTNNRQEYKDGAHLHFEVWENGVKISPYKYLTINEK